MSALTLTITRGVPGSGKSTWSRQFCRDTGARRVNRDDLRAMMGLPSRGSMLQEEIVTAVQRAAIVALFDAGCDVVADDTNLPPHVLTSWRDFAAACGVRLNVVDHFLAVPVATLLERNSARQGREKIPVDVLMLMHRGRPARLDA